MCVPAHASVSEKGCVCAYESEREMVSHIFLPNVRMFLNNVKILKICFMKNCIQNVLTGPKIKPNKNTSSCVTL